MSAPASALPVAPQPASAGWLPALALLSNAAVWGVSWLPIRELQRMGLHPLWATALFFGLSALVVWLFRRDSWPELLAHPGLWVLGLATGLTNATFNWALTLGEVVRVVLLFYLMPVWAVFLARWLLNERIDTKAALRIALALAGAVVILRPEGGGWPTLDRPADWLGVAGGLGFALTNVMLRRQVPRTPQARALSMFVGGFLLPAVLGVALAAAGDIPAPPAPAPGWVGVGLGMAVIYCLANVALQYGAARLPVHAAAVIMLTEIIFATASSVWLGGESLAPTALAGGALILSASVLAAWQR
jgi:drug/metabolite transporter (DMT)-like permease